MKESPKNLVGYCGLYCGACGIYQGRIKQAVESLRSVIGAYGFDKIMPELAKMFGECPGCIGGGGDPNCAVRECAKQKAYTTCAECAEMERCEKVQRYGPCAMDGLRKIKAVGVGKWTEEMQKKVDAGYCYLDERT